jgi:hypothetical protein
VDVRGLEPLTPCLQRKLGQNTKCLSGVAYTRINKIFALSNVPKLSRTRQLQANILAVPALLN